MALKLPIPFPIFIHLLNPTPPHHHRPPTELRFSRWNNANAEKFNERRRTIQQIEDDIRRQRRFDSVSRIADAHDSSPPSCDNAGAGGEAFKSVGTPSFPSKPSIPGRKSKYSKNPNPPISDPHPAFRPLRRVRKTAVKELKEKLDVNRKADVRVGEDGVSYVIDGAPFEFKYSYTETPKTQPVKLREAPYAPFGPTTMPRPWTGRAPLPPSKKKLREFDSFRLPPPHKKGVKPVQAPGPYLPGSGPRYVMSREEILGDPLTEEEIKDLIDGCRKIKRQLNMGRDGLTHNMLDNIHAHWKRRRVCKIKCKGVCTVDMDNVRQQLEERTGGKIIYSKGGVIFLFRGRNYNFRTRPRFPLMLWKPVTPVYPRLVQRVPEGLTPEEVTEMRKKGHNLPPICKLGKNGVYMNLVKNVREAFEECELVRINCEGMNGSDYRKIGAKLKDLVPCVLLSFANEHILMWRGCDWKSSLPEPEKNLGEDKEPDVENATSVAPSVEGVEVTTSTGSVNDASLELLSTSTLHRSHEVMGGEGIDDSSSMEYIEPSSSTGEVSNEIKTLETEKTSDVRSPVDDRLEVTPNYSGITIENFGSSGTRLGNTECDGPSMSTSGSDTITPNVDLGNAKTKSDSFDADSLANEKPQVTSEVQQDVSEPATSIAACTEVVLSLLQQAVEGGLAVVLDEEDLDADVVYQKTVAFSQSAPPGPIFVRPRKNLPKKVLVENSEIQENEKQDTEDLAPREMARATSVKLGRGKKASKARRKKDFGEHLDNVVPQGSLRIDELAKLLA